MAQVNNAGGVKELQAALAKVRETTYSVEEAALKLGVVEMRVRNLCREGKLVATKVTGAWLIDRKSVDAYAKAKKVRASKAAAKRAAKQDYENAIAKLDAEIASLQDGAS
jgi:excisionase family DNA binding protein